VPLLGKKLLNSLVVASPVHRKAYNTDPIPSRSRQYLETGIAKKNLRTVLLRDI